MIVHFFAQLPNKTGLPDVNADQNSLNNILAIFFGVVAALAVLSIIIAGFNFVTSDGDPEKISRSKRTIILALIGLVIAMSAEAIVLTVLRKL
jgi:type IV secretory pathway VirB2 component (pilin)